VTVAEIAQRQDAALEIGSTPMGGARVGMRFRTL